MEQAGWEWKQAMDEKERETIEALQRCIKAGADADAIKTLARECGIDLKYLTIGERNASH